MNRTQLIKLIHVAKRELRLDDDTYRQLLTTITTKTSTRDMDVPQLDNVMKAMKKRGFKIKPARKANSTIPLDDAPQSRKIRALWLEMADTGIIRDRSEAAMVRWVKRETDVDSLRWLGTEDASQVIEKLKKWQCRARKYA
ncbi:regulatory protein GemA [Pectobacteriaceae bacterium CE90]|nr:regulatory protein GemA [Pectobacteriaceae bacterium CE90]